MSKAGVADVRPRQVETPQASAQSVNDLMTGMELGFTLGCICALVVGLFLGPAVLAALMALWRDWVAPEEA